MREHRIQVNTGGWMGKKQVFVYIQNGDGTWGFAEPVTFKHYAADYDDREPTPLIELSDTQSQQLMDELWKCGVRPSEGSGSAGSLLATQRHLDDMRALVFHALKMPMSAYEAGVRR